MPEIRDYFLVSALPYPDTTNKLLLLNEQVELQAATLSIQTSLSGTEIARRTTSE